METIRICSGCLRPLPVATSSTLCPECLLKAELKPGSPTGGQNAGFVPPGVGQIAGLFPQLEIIELVGQGGMGAVYKARQPGLDRLVALKVLPPHSRAHPGFAERFNREARALAKLSHSNIVAVYDFGQTGGLSIRHGICGRR